MSGKERENLLKLYLLIVEYAQAAVIDFFKLHLTNNGLNFEDFINLNKHDIYHLCYNNRKCCKPGCTISFKTPYVLRRIIYPDQLNILLDYTSGRIACHKPNCNGDYCGRLGKPGIQTDVLDVTLANCLLINFCQDLFWNCCLTQGQDLTSFLNCNKHTIFHLRNGSNVCCMCSSPSCAYVTQQTGVQYNWHFLFNGPSGNNCGKFGTQCICSLSATVGLLQTDLDEACTRALHKQCCHARRALDILVNYRNIYGHLNKTCVSNTKYSRDKSAISNAIMILATLFGKETQTKQKMSDLENISLDVQLCEQYKNTLMEQIRRDSKIEEVISGLPGKMESIFENITKPRFNRLERKVDNLTNICCASERQSTISENTRQHNDIPSANDLGDHFESSHCKSRFQTGLKTVFKLLSSFKYLDRNLCAVVTTVESLFKTFRDTQVEDELHRFIEKKNAEKVVCEYEGTMQYFISAVIFISDNHGKSMLNFVRKIEELHAVVFMGGLGQKINNLKALSVKRRNFKELMIYIHCYVNMSFMRDLTLALCCRILEIHSEEDDHDEVLGMRRLMEYNKSRDKELVQFLVEPTENTLAFNFMYNSNDWPAVDNILTNYFFPNKKTQNPLNYLCDGEFVIKPLKYPGACLYMADVDCAWLRWSNEENEQSRFKFIRREIGGKIYYQIFSVKWVKYYASMGLASWWTRGVTGTIDNMGLWEIISFESNDFPAEELYMFSPKDSQSNFMIVDACRRVYGSRCLPCVNTFFKIESRFVDALEEQDSVASEE